MQLEIIIKIITKKQKKSIFKGNMVWYASVKLIETQYAEVRLLEAGLQKGQRKKL